MHSTVQMYFAANNILLMRNWNHLIKIWKQTWWSNDKTIIDPGYRKISKYLSVSRKTDLFATRKNHDILLNLVLVSSWCGCSHVKRFHGNSRWKRWKVGYCLYSKACNFKFECHVQSTPITRTFKGNWKSSSYRQLRTNDRKQGKNGVQRF